MVISLEEVNRIAQLSKLSFTEAEKQKLQAELSAILEFVDKLKQTEGRIETGVVDDQDSVNLMRDDVVEPVTDPEVFLQQAPSRQDGYVKVKSILE
jgi:aspartyl-tRNA(Asn)/glutamyl-tRNA(Gln) amidotransferase subunit C